MSPVLRPETPADAPAIAALTARAFRDLAHSSQTEPHIIDALRAAGALAVSLVAEAADGRLVGHVACSPVTLSDGTPGWYGLGPISVDPAGQRQGLGSALMRAALDALRARGAAGCVLLGDPAFYGRFGFRPDAGPRLAGVPPGYFQALSFGGDLPQADVRYHPGFEARGDAPTAA